MDDDRRHLLTIGRFAGMTGIAAKRLRHYDAVGLLCPAVTDQETGYRLYSLDQLDTGVLVGLLHDLEVPLAEIAVLIGPGAAERTRDVLREHRRHILERRTETDRILARIDRALEVDHGLLPYAGELVTLDPIWVVSVRTTTPQPEIDPNYARCLGELRQRLADLGVAASGREIVLYHNPLQWYEGLEMEVCLPIAPSDAAAAGAWQLPGGAAARTLCLGPYTDIWRALATLLAWAAQRDHVVCGPVREFYVVDERDTDDPAGFVTELTLPVRSRKDSGS